MNDHRRESLGISKLHHRFKIALSLGLIILVGYISNMWVLKKDNFFYADDWGWFLYSRTHDLVSYLRIIPAQMYNDRPVGQLFLKFLFLIFGYDYVSQHAILLFIHILNGFAVFFLARTLPLFKKQTLGSLVSAIIFVGWQSANFAVQWSAAVFDLLSICLVVAFLVSIIKYLKTGKVVFCFISCLSYFLALRTKESNLFLPFVAIALTVLIYKKPLILLRKFIPLLLIWLTYTLILILLAAQTNFQGLNEVAAYKSSFSPIILLRNVFRYIMLYFDNSNVYQTYQRNIGFTVIIALLGSVYAYFLYTRRRQDIPVIVFFVISVLLTLLPVLSLEYSTLRLYLYVPSIFFSLFLSFFTFQVSKHRYLNTIVWIAIILYINLLNKGAIATRDRWLSMGRENHKAFENTKKLHIPSEVKKISVINAKKPTNLFRFGNGDVLRLLLNDNTLDIHISPRNNKVAQDSYLIDYSRLIIN